MPSHPIDLFGEPSIPGQVCTACKVWKPLANYSHLSTSPNKKKSYYRGSCKPCYNKEIAAWYHKNKHGLAFTRMLKSKYGITCDDYYAIVKSQGGGCGICGKNGHTKHRLAVDHDHATGKVRGVLCHLCNQAIGQLKHDLELLQKAIDYLKKHT